MEMNRNKFFLGLAIIAFVSTPLVSAQEHEVITYKTEPTVLVQCIHEPAYRLFQWPAQPVLNGPNRVDSDANEVTWPKKQCLEWLIKRVLAPSWLPPKDVELIFIRNEFDNRDVVRMVWERNGYNIQVSQTASIFAMKLSPVSVGNTGVEKSQKLENVRQLCLQVFTEMGRRWDHQGNTVLIKELSKKIVSYSFRPEMSRYLKDDRAVYGRPQTMNEAGVKQPQNDVEALRERDPNNPNWDKTASSYSYWFRMVNWWNDGKSIGFYFLKVEEGAWIPSYCGDIDKNFFKK
jgi:hypothetical protein